MFFLCYVKVILLFYLFYFALHCFALYCFALLSIVLHCIVLYCFAMLCVALQSYCSDVLFLNKYVLIGFDSYSFFQLLTSVYQYLKHLFLNS